jgi:tetratricopeptide (TPR) repeat protein
MLESAVDDRFQQPHELAPPEKDEVVEGKLWTVLQMPGKSTILHLHRFIFSLKAFSLVLTSMSPNSVMINYHPIVNTWSRDLLSPTDHTYYAAMATRVVSTCTCPKYYLVHSLLLPHIREIMKRPTELYMNDRAAFALRFTHGGFAAEGESTYRKLLEECGEQFGMDDERTLFVLNNLAVALKNQGQMGEAIQMEEQVLSGKNEIYNEDDDGIWKTELNLANSYTIQGRWNDAERIYQRLLITVRERYGERHPRTLRVIIGAANCYGRQGLYHEALLMREELYKNSREVLGEEHPETLATMINLAESYATLERWPEAEKMQKDSLQISIRIHGKDHPHTLGIQMNLSVSLRLQDKLNEALTYAEQAVEGNKRVQGQTHPDTLLSLDHLVRTYLCLGRLGDAAQLAEELIAAEGEDGQYGTELIELLRQTLAEIDPDNHLLVNFP